LLARPIDFQLQQDARHLMLTESGAPFELTCAAENPMDMTAFASERACLCLTVRSHSVVPEDLAIFIETASGRLGPIPIAVDLTSIDDNEWQQLCLPLSDLDAHREALAQVTVPFGLTTSLEWDFALGEVRYERR
jgi:hypothetical protein